MLSESILRSDFSILSTDQENFINILDYFKLQTVVYFFIFRKNVHSWAVDSEH